MRQRFIRLLGAFTALALCAGATAACAGAKHGSIPAHVDTWAFDDGCSGGNGAPGHLVRRWLTYAESNCGPNTSKAVRDCHGGLPRCKVMQYLDSEWYYPSDNLRLAHAAASDWWLHPPAGSRSGPLGGVFTSAWGGGYLLNQLNPSVRAAYQAYVRANYNADDGLLMDWQSPSLSQELFYSNCGCTTTREIGSDGMLQRAHAEMAAAMTHRDGTPFLQADNSLASNPYLPQGFGMLDGSLGVGGWVAEGRPVDGGTIDTYYSTLLDQMAYIATRTSGFIVLLARAPAGASYQGQSRRVQEATVLLGYRPGRVVDWADLEQGSGRLAVWPEEGIVPTRPVQSMRAPGGRACLAGTGTMCSRGGRNNVQVAAGVYRRVFRRCYSRRTSIGACAAIVNTTGRSIAVRASWLRGASLHHQIALVGGDVQSGGRIAAAAAPFAAGTTVVGAHDALLLAS